MKAIINGKIILKDKIEENRILLFDDKIIGIFDELPENIKDDVEIIDAKEKYVSPGLIDIHVHGSLDYDFMSADIWEIKEIEEYLLSNGITGYLATTTAISKEKMYNALENIKKYTKRRNKNKAILGVRLEIPFFNENYTVAQDHNFITKSDYDFIKDYEDIINIITYTPEKGLDLELAKYTYNSNDIVLSIEHTNTAHEEAYITIDANTQGVTHLFNTTPSINYRNLGVSGVSISKNIKCESIVDGIHTNKDVFELLVTDVMGLNEAIKNFHKNTSLSLNEAIQLASLNPAKSLNIDKIKGSLEIGKDADIAIFDENIECFMTIVKGEIKYEKFFNINDIKNKLSSLPNKKVKTINGLTLCDSYGSYRGDYCDLYVEINQNNEITLSSHELINLLDRALNDRVMYGYKGGEFYIEENTLVVLANYGEATGYYIKDIYLDGEYIIIEHEKQ